MVVTLFLLLFARNEVDIQFGIQFGWPSGVQCKGHSTSEGKKTKWRERCLRGGNVRENYDLVGRSIEIHPNPIIMPE